MIAEQQLKTMRFMPEVYIEIDDVATGERKMARVAENGTTYLDLADDDATPFPIWEHLKPEEVGNILGWGLWLVDHHREDYPSWTGLVDRLIHSGQDVLTYNRAAHWAFKNRNYDYAKAIAAGVQATERVRLGRKKLDGILQRSGELK